ncbi:MAG: phosphoribosyltransferase family protein, partial [Candidatus Diapherotrites archaeon]
LYVIKADYYKNDRAETGMKFNPEPLITQKLDRQIEGKRILVVDEVTDSGATAFMVKKYIESLKPSEARYLMVHWKPWSKFKPDYYAEEADGWIVYPWAKKD